MRPTARVFIVLCIALMAAACQTETELVVNTATPEPTPIPSPTPPEPALTFEQGPTPGTYEGQIETEGSPINVLVSLPPGFNPQGSYALEIHLPHGGTVGGTMNDLRGLGRAFPLANQPDEYPFIVAYAQLPGDDVTWYALADEVIAYKDALLAQFPIDEEQVYLTGYSNGGRGALEVGTQYADQFAAVAVYAGFYNRDEAELCGFGSTPLHLYHGRRDDTVAVEESEALHEAINACEGGNAALTILDNAGHFDLWVRLLQSTTVYDWLLEHRL